jgi:hypothetical protein
MFFDDYPEFFELDIRNKRSIFPVTSETLTRRCESMLPKNLIENKTVLDLGSALGAMGMWSLKNEASHYCGVEIQEFYRENSKELLSKHFNNFQILKEIEEVDERYDVVLAAGYVHGFLDPFSILEKICKRSKKYVILETMVSSGSTFTIELQRVNMIDTKNSTKKTSGYSGMPSKPCLDLIMSFNGFKIEKQNIIPNIKNSDNLYGIRRHIIKYVADKPCTEILEKEIRNEHVGI